MTRPAPDALLAIKAMLGVSGWWARVLRGRGRTGRMGRMKRIVIAALLAFALAGCAQPPPPAPFTVERAPASIVLPGHPVEIPPAPYTTEESAPASGVLAGRDVEVPPERRPTIAWAGFLSFCEWGAEQALLAIWRVCASDSCGTAFHVGDGYWLTAAHVADGDGLRLYDHGGRWHKARVVSSLDAFSELEGWERAAEDGALLHAPSTSGVHAVKRASATPSEARIVGHPRGRFRELGVVVERSPRGLPAGVAAYSGSLGPGSSGSPVMDQCGGWFATHFGVGHDGTGYGVTRMSRPSISWGR